MNESMLQREFRERDVQRMRNLITKNYDAKTVTQTGYVKKHIEYKEGDIWKENNKTWTIKNGIKVTVSKLDDLKKLTVLPLTCPKCKCALKSTNINKKMWYIHKMCFECVIKMETELKRDGKYEEYAKNMIKKGMSKHVEELEQLLLEIALNPTHENFVTEQGDIETWKSSFDSKQITQELQTYIQSIKNILDS